MPQENKNPDLSRRNFLKAMGVLAVGVGVAGILRGVVIDIIPPNQNVESGYPTLQLALPNGNPVHTSDLIVNNPQIVIFNYPLQNEPNFLLRLGDSNNNDVALQPTEVTIPATGAKFTSPGGVGPYKSVVASSAICQHLGCVPPEIRFHPPNDTSYPGKIHCDCHGSTYDPYQGFSVVAGPTQSPLPNVKLVYDATNDTYSASLMIGPVIYGRTSDLSGGNPISGNSTEVTTIS
jgi:Rieske Fe-S protein